VHVALHGCKQDAGLIGDHYTRHAGYNEWADTNRIIILYPQTIASTPILDFGTPFNPNGCWDWWGYTDARYATRSGRQIAAIKAMLDRLAGGRRAPAEPPGVAVAPLLLAIDASDDAIALAWTETAGAGSYRVSRAAGPRDAFTVVATTTGLSFADSGLAPATGYRYRVTAVAAGEEGPLSNVVAATTRARPPPCRQPGTCKIAVTEPAGRR
jgi:hypothetical protein